MANSRLWVISGCADVATGKRRIKSGMLSADMWIKDGCADNSCHVHYQS